MDWNDYRPYSWMALDLPESVRISGGRTGFPSLTACPKLPDQLESSRKTGDCESLGYFILFHPNTNSWCSFYKLNRTKIGPKKLRGIRLIPDLLPCFLRRKNETSAIGWLIAPNHQRTISRDVGDCINIHVWPRHDVRVYGRNLFFNSPIAIG